MRKDNFARLNLRADGGEGQKPAVESVLGGWRVNQFSETAGSDGSEKREMSKRSRRESVDADS
ncbi:MAG TPA: hypothetical protein VF656_05085, partial [Pyrinomonadaceae bacterium]